MVRLVGRARWLSHVNGVNPGREMRTWITDTASLTIKLMSRSSEFRVRCLHQRIGLCLADEMNLLELRHRRCVREREVLLQCDGRPVIFAHTVVPLSATASDWPHFRGLGERPLGTTLFGDARVERGSMQYARLPMRHPLVRRANEALGADGPDAIRHPPCARRCLYRRKNGVLLVTEVFLPAILETAVATADNAAKPRMRMNESNKQSI
ncbi:MAG: chorismate lyase [Noviherbaspirillum sp.]|nr:chorismate lyase [Noviherbaspirillum sp.]